MYVAVEGGRDEIAHVELQNPGRLRLAQELDLRVPQGFHGDDALYNETDRQYRQACIVFDSPLREYFPVTIGANMNENTLCTDIEMVRT